MSIEATVLYQEMNRRAVEISSGPKDLLSEFERLRTVVQEYGKYIVLVFPEYTPHDYTRHLDHLFTLADRILGTQLYAKLSASELVLLGLGLYAHDWGMAVSLAEREALTSRLDCQSFTLLPEEPSGAQKSMERANRAGVSGDAAWRDYVRITHGLRSGARLRKLLEPLGTVFADAAAKIAEGHVLDMREVRDTYRYPLALSVFGETINLQALTTYVRVIDLLDIGEDRTPFVLWKFVSPVDPISAMEWRKHRALSPISVRTGAVSREILISGITDDPVVFAALADLRSWIDGQFVESIAHLRLLPDDYQLDLDSRITWNIVANGFEPLSVRFELDRREVLGLLSSELYQDDPLAFIRELLQNSVDAIEIRQALLERQGLSLNGEIRVKITSTAECLSIEWSDNGIGMDEDILSSYYATLGRSWYKSREAMSLGNVEAISKFGVGVLSCFAVSDKITIETKRDPQISGPKRGLVVTVPSRESHFRIRTDTQIPVGTLVRLEIPLHLSRGLASCASIIAALVRIARFVQHKVVIDSDGILTEVTSYSRPQPSSARSASSPDIGPRVVGIRGDSAEALADNTFEVAFEFGNTAGDFFGLYSAVIPKGSAELIEHSSVRVWRLGTKDVQLDEVFIDSEQALFVKGIQTGRVSGSSPRMWRQVEAEDHGLHSRYSEWIEPRLLVNVRHPSYVEFNLARSSVHLTNKQWVVHAWQEIAIKLKECLNQAVATPSDTAFLLGRCAEFGGIPNEGLSALVTEDDTPALVLRSETGLTWTTIRELTHAQEFMEAPYELSYRFGHVVESGISGLYGWEGEDALVQLDSRLKRFPWLEPVLDFGIDILGKLGWAPVELRIVKSPLNEAVPLVCRIWKKSPLHQNGGDTEAPHWAVLKVLFADHYPELLRFPETISEYAAIGSRYWNVEHPKIKKIVRSLLALVDRVNKKGMSAEKNQSVRYFTGHKFLDYVVPSRSSGPRLALDAPNGLLDIAQEEGLADYDRLVQDDFFPGTVGRYSNPYHYDMNGWIRAGNGLGKRLS